MCFEALGPRMYPSHISILRGVSESLLRTGPLHALRGSKAAALLPHDDVAALSMKALEILIDALGLRPGATREEIGGGFRRAQTGNEAPHLSARLGAGGARRRERHPG